MNRWQQVAVWVGVLTIVGMFLYPPWQTKFGDNDVSIDNGYALLFVGPVDNSAVEAWERQREERESALGRMRASMGLPVPNIGERPEPKRLITSDLNYRRLLTQWLLVAIVTGAAVLTFRDGPVGHGVGQEGDHE